jgi:hypothetical protein
MSDLTGVIVHITIGDTPATVDHLIAGLRWLADQPAGDDTSSGLLALRSSGSILFSAEQVLTPREAALGSARTVPLDDAAGQVSAEIVTPYPPGIPVIAPGERFSHACIDYLKLGRSAGMYISGPSDPELATVQVVDG